MFLGIILTILFNNLLSITRGPMGLPGIPPVAIGHYQIINRVPYYYLTLFFILLVMIFKYKLINSRLGRALIAIREGEALAESIGINTHKYKIFAFTISAAIAGIAGALYAHFLSYIGPSSFTFEQSMELFTMNLIGGAGTMAGPIIGTALLTVFAEVARNFSPALARIAFGLFLVLAIIFTPKGIMGLIEKVRNR
ncbi:MAG: hypothetical protein DRP55_07925 [Spirochaetes bacterium]|nr:MAG: hypothetical protein DRP55_07925 [Spirochaetota bacterium]